MPIDERSEEQAWKRAETRVIDAARLGDARAFEILWMRFAPKIEAFTRRMCWHYRLNGADDAWSEVYLAVAGSVATFDPDRARNRDAGAAFCNWAYRIAARVVVGQLSRRQRVTTREVGVADWDEIPGSVLTDPREGPVERLERREIVGRIYDKLDADANAERAEYLRLIAEGLSQQEAATRVGVNPATGRSWLNRFRSEMEANGEQAL